MEKWKPGISLGMANFVTKLGQKLEFRETVKVVFFFPGDFVLFLRQSQAKGKLELPA